MCTIKKIKRFSLKVVLLKNGSVAPTIELRLHPRRGKSRLIINPLLPVVPNAPLSTACPHGQVSVERDDGQVCLHRVRQPELRKPRETFPNGPDTSR